MMGIIKFIVNIPRMLIRGKVRNMAILLLVVGAFYALAFFPNEAAEFANFMKPFASKIWMVVGEPFVEFLESQ